MKYLKQFLIIVTISFAGEGLKYLLPLPVPASIYGMVLLFVLLLSGILKLDAVKDVGKFLIEIMPVMFIPAGVGLMSSWRVLKPLLVPVSIITVVSLVLVMVCSGRMTQFIIRRGKKPGNGEGAAVKASGNIDGRDMEAAGELSMELTGKQEV